MKRSWVPSAETFPKKNALTPIGALSFGIFGASIVGAIYLGDSPMGWAILGLGSIPLIATVWGFVYFARNDADRLQTEDYRIQKEYVARIGRSVEADTYHLPSRDEKPVLKTGKDFDGE